MITEEQVLTRIAGLKDAMLHVDELLESGKILLGEYESRMDILEDRYDMCLWFLSDG